MVADSSLNGLGACKLNPLVIGGARTAKRSTLFRQ